jgi:hypothetical protein
MFKSLVLVFFFFASILVNAQVVNTGTTDTLSGSKLGNISIGGYIDAFYAYNFNQPEDGNIPYFVSMSRHNEANINLAFLDLRYSNERLRARIAPGFGSYMNANYAAEPGALKFLVEANAGVKLSKKKDIWLDFGIFGSPYTNESCVSRDHLMYTRSLAPEYVPYYLAGAKLSIPLNEKWNLYVYLLNGWQQIQDQNKGKSLGTQLEYRPNEKNLINWDIYIGDERSAAAPDNRMRYFTDIYWIHNPSGKFSLTSCAYIGLQDKNNLSFSESPIWWQANIIGRYKFTKNISVSGRVEYFNDTDAVQIVNINNPSLGFRTLGSGLCFNLNLFNNAMFRLEGRQLYSLDEAFKNKDGNQSSWSNWLVGNLTIWF